MAISPPLRISARLRPRINSSPRGGMSRWAVLSTKPIRTETALKSGLSRTGWTKTHSKILQLLLELKISRQVGQNPKIEVPHHGGVLIVGDVPNDIPHKANKGPAASVRARKWKAAWRMIRETED